MKNWTVLLLFFTLASQAQVVFENTLALTFEKAQRLNKPVFIKYYNSDCSVCGTFQSILDTDAAVIDFYNANFINYALNTKDSTQQADIALLKNANLHFETVPMAVFFDKDQQFLHYSGVQLNSEYIVTIGKMVLNASFRTAALAARYENGDRTVRTLYAYSDYLVVTQEATRLKSVSQDLFEAFKKEELPTMKSYIVLKNVVQHTENGFFQYWITHLDQLKEFETGSHAGQEKDVLVTIVLKELSNSDRKNWPKAKKEQFKKYILALKMSETPEQYFE